MQQYDVIVLGGGTGNIVASGAADHGLDVALIEAGPLGGTCLNRGCNPSKKLIHRADVLETVDQANDFEIDAVVDDLSFPAMTENVTATVTETAERKAEHARNHDNITFYQAEGQFIDDHTVAVDGVPEPLTASDIVLAGGTRPLIPDSIDGTESVEYLTNEDALRLDHQPQDLVIIGGGYVAAELAHLFDAIGTAVTIVGRSDVLAPREDDAIADRLTDAYADKHDLYLGYEANGLESGDDATIVTAESETGNTIDVAGEEVLIATGRRPNTDRWNVSATNITTDDAGYVETDDTLETAVDGVWAIGDILGTHPFKHAGDKEAEYVVQNVVEDTRQAVTYPGMAHAIFGAPQIAGLGKTESEIADERTYEVGTVEYDDTALGAALATDTGFAKAIVGNDDEVIGVHIIGPHAANLIHEVSTAVAAGGDAETIAEAIHVHPALSEVVQKAFRQVRPVAPRGL